MLQCMSAIPELRQGTKNVAKNFLHIDMLSDNQFKLLIKLVWDKPFRKQLQAWRNFFISKRENEFLRSLAAHQPVLLLKDHVDYLMFGNDFGDKLGIAVFSATRSEEEDLRQAAGHAKQTIKAAPLNLCLRLDRDHCWIKIDDVLCPFVANGFDRKECLAKPV